FTGDSNEQSLKLLCEYDFVFNLRFSYRECRCRIPILKKVEGGYHAIYPYLSAYPKESEAQKIKISQMIAGHAGVDIVSHSILYLNKDYEREDKLDVKQLFVESDQFFNRRNHPGKNIDECMQEFDINLDEWIDEVNASMEQEPSIQRTKKCTSNRKCKYYDMCFDESLEPDDSVLFLTTSQYKLQAYEEGIRHIKDLDVDKLDGFRLQYAQYMASKNNVFMDRSALLPWIQQIRYPISYLDFEWDTFAIPPYPKMKPFDVLCFQYSLHIEKEDGTLSHLDFFGTGDCRIRFIESLIQNIPETGTILVYNMEGAEKLRLIQLSQQFPQYEKQMESIWTRMVDLSKPFELGLYYDNKMRGHYSLKNVMPAFSDEYSYKELDIQTGLNAVWAYRTFDDCTDNQKKELIEQLRNYCALDTLSEYIVYHGLIDKLKEG
ncbi:MAG: DUF2779 domain-containing protein, partial [Holdemanella sp.]|nr:DUF2779 domain-containing protein [Holdemanella sp.]